MLYDIVLGASSLIAILALYELVKSVIRGWVQSTAATAPKATVIGLERQGDA